MRKPQILSTLFPEEDSASHYPTSPPGLRPATRAFNACEAGMVLRAVVFVELVMGVGALFLATEVLDWLLMLAELTAVALPATLAWLVMVCRLQQRLPQWSSRLHALLGVVLGAAAGMGSLALQRSLRLPADSGGSPPWWATAALGALIAGVLLSMLLLRARGRTPAATAARLTELQSRIRPHFLFNSLNSAIALVRAEPQRAEELLEDLSELFRHALRDAGEAVTLDEEIELAQRYLAIEQVRFGERLQVQWALDPQVHHALLPPLLLQPLVENAVRHGVEPCAQGGKLRIMTALRHERAEVRITNTLPPVIGPDGERAHRPGHGIALRNVRDRLALLHDFQAELRTRVQGDLYEVRLRLPLPRQS